MKKIGIITTIIVLIMISIFTFIALKDNSEPQEQVSTQEEEEEEITEQELPDNSEEPNEDSLTDKISETVNDMVEKTINLFKKDRLNIVAIGDSLTQGVGDESENGGYVGMLRDELKNSNLDEVTIDNYGVRGNRTDHLIKRLKEDEISASIKESDLIIITIGANDIMKIVKENFLSLNYEVFANEQPGFQDRLEEIFNEIRRLNDDAHIFLIGLFNPFAQYFEDIPELDKIISDFNFISQKVLLNYEPATYIPIHDVFFNAEEDLFAEDNFHPNTKGYELIGERILIYLEQTFGVEQE